MVKKILIDTIEGKKVYFNLSLKRFYVEVHGSILYRMDFQDIINYIHFGGVKEIKPIPIIWRRYSNASFSNAEIIKVEISDKLVIIKTDKNEISREHLPSSTVLLKTDRNNKLVKEIKKLNNKHNIIYNEMMKKGSLLTQFKINKHTKFNYIKDKESENAKKAAQSLCRREARIKKKGPRS